MNHQGSPLKQAKWVSHSCCFPSGCLPFSVLANAAGLLSHRQEKITNPVCGRWCGSGTLGTEPLCWKLFVLPGSLAPAFPCALHPPSLFHSPSLPLPDPYAQNLRLISSSAGQSPLCISLVFFSVHAKGVVTLNYPEVRVRRWRACCVTLYPLLVISVEWPDRTASSAPRPSMVSGFMEVGWGVALFVPERSFCCSLVSRTLLRHALISAAWLTAD